MSITYNPITDFLTKDTLPKEDPDKVILGADFAAEFDAISTAFLGAASLSSPTFTGTVTFDVGSGTSLTLSSDATVGGTLTAGPITSGDITSGAITSTGNGSITGDLAVSGTITAGGSTLVNASYVQAQIATAELGTISELNDLSNVDETGKANGDFLAWDSVAGNWEPQPLDLANLSVDVLTSGTVTAEVFFEDYELKTDTTVIDPYRFDLVVDTTEVYPWASSSAALFYASNDSIYASRSNDIIYRLDFTTPEDLTTGFTNGTLSLAGSLTSPICRSITVSPDGTKLLHDQHNSIGTGWKEMHQWTMSTPFNLTTASYDGSFNTNGEQFPIWNDDGTVLYTFNGNNLNIQETVINVPYDLIGSTTRNNSTAQTLANISNTRLQGSFFNDDGTKWYVTDNASIYTCDLSTAYDLSTAVVDTGATISNAFNGSNQIWAMGRNDDGTRLFQTDQAAVEISSYDIFNTEHNLVIDCEEQGVADFTLTGNGSMSFTNVPASGTAFAVTLIIRQDAADSGFTLSWPANTEWQYGTPPTLSSGAGATDVFVLLTYDGGASWYGFVSGQEFA